MGAAFKMQLDCLSLLALAPPPEGQQPGGFFQFIPILMILGIFYFLVFAPMRKKQKAHTEMLTALKSGDRIVTTGGILGTVVGVDDKVVHVRIADQVKIEVAKHAVAEKVTS